MMTLLPANIPHFIHGEDVAGTSGRFGDVFNPATGNVTGMVPLASKAEVEAAIASAQAAFPAWAATTPLNRARVMFKFKELLEQTRRRDRARDHHASTARCFPMPAAK